MRRAPSPDQEEKHMPDLNTIVAATDFSDAANRAVWRATLIARKHGAQLHLLHVTTPLALYPGQEINPSADEAPMHERFAVMAQMLSAHYGISVHLAQRIGRAHTQIADYATTVGAELVAVGARGESSMPRLLLGSTASRLLRVRRGAVLIVRGEPTQPYAQVLAAVDFFVHTQAVAKWARKLAGDAQVRLLHVLEAINESGLRPRDSDDVSTRRRQDQMRAIAENLMADLHSRLGGEADKRIESGHPPARILECAKDWQSDLIVLGRQGSIGLEEFLLGSVSKNVIQAADCDVLVVSENSTR
jgi:nucleotide-binding universal stress UspA family protein